MVFRETADAFSAKPYDLHAVVEQMQQLLPPFER
jgi:hypothetical protein